MEQRAVGNSGLRVSRLGLGTLGWGRETDADEAAAQLVAFVDAGGTLVDTSPAYGDGAAQTILADLIGDLVPRSAVVLSGTSGINPSPEAHSRIDCSRRGLLAQLEGTLRELGTDHLDLWQVAAWDPRTPMDEVLATLDHALRTGRTRYAGARGYWGWQLATAAEAARRTGSRLVATQAEYSLLSRGVEDELIPAAQFHGIGVLAAVPLARGVLTGKYRDGTPSDSRGASELRASELDGYLTDDSSRVVHAVVTAADGLGVSPLAVALSWVRDRPGVASAIVGTRDRAQLEGVLAAEDVRLPAAIAIALDDVSA